MEFFVGDEYKVENGSGNCNCTQPETLDYFRWGAYVLCSAIGSGFTVILVGFWICLVLFMTFRDTLNFEMKKDVFKKVCFGLFYHFQKLGNYNLLKPLSFRYRSVRFLALIHCAGGAFAVVLFISTVFAFYKFQVWCLTQAIIEQFCIWVELLVILSYFTWRFVEMCCCTRGYVDLDESTEEDGREQVDIDNRVSFGEIVEEYVSKEGSLHQYENQVEDEEGYGNVGGSSVMKIESYVKSWATRFGKLVKRQLSCLFCCPCKNVEESYKFCKTGAYKNFTYHILDATSMCSKWGCCKQTRSFKGKWIKAFTRCWQESQNERRCEFLNCSFIFITAMFFTLIPLASNRGNYDTVGAYDLRKEGDKTEWCWINGFPNMVLYYYGWLLVGLIYTFVIGILLLCGVCCCWYPRWSDATKNSKNLSKKAKRRRDDYFRDRVVMVNVLVYTVIFEFWWFAFFHRLVVYINHSTEDTRLTSIMGAFQELQMGGFSGFLVCGNFITMILALYCPGVFKVCSIQEWALCCFCDKMCNCGGEERTRLSVRKPFDPVEDDPVDDDDDDDVEEDVRRSELLSLEQRLMDDKSDSLKKLEAEETKSSETNIDEDILAHTPYGGMLDSSIDVIGSIGDLYPIGGEEKN